ncbi:fungal-specific transcription factor domain-containing protein [Colletotrichum zoysiae]|uniref:Fungal-specific transcription factor domain-containing protein n=1 Tax=Colletotrichum zoysiae TaxID=1216348 RepID=A0AAD9HH88_9PEZI|nr:fungal-specific transcription factor domain-containing protein [Colletotrichum zoysiae]
MEEKEPKPPLNGRLLPELPLSNINLIFGRQRFDSPSMLHPSAVQSFRLWQVFTSNVHPLTKVLHGPSVQEELLRSLAEPSSTDGPTEALIFSIYLIAVVSLTDVECRNLLGETREKHVARYRHAAEAALSRVDFLRSTELKVLQALTLYLFSLRQLCDQDILWLLTGLAARMGQRMGMHRESSLRNLSPFEAELRRRVWWQIVILDGRATQLTGDALGTESRLCGNTNPPTGVNDGDLVPSMSSLPQPPYVPTEMVFCSVRIEIAVWMIRHDCLLGQETTPRDRTKLLRSIDELESLLEERYLRHINSDIPLNLLTIHLARSTVCQLRLSVYHPIHHPEKAASCMSPEQLDLLLENSLEVVRHDIAAHTTRSLQRFTWHVSNFFPFEAFILLINTLSRIPASPVADAAWSVIDQVFENHPRFASDTGDPLYWALGSIMIKAWDRRVSAARAGSLEPLAEPPCVRELVRRRAALRRCSQSSQETPTAANSTGLTKPQGPQRSKDMPGYDGRRVEASQPQPLQGDSATVGATDDQIFCITDDMELDWGFWQELLDRNAQSGRDAEETYSFPFFMSES